MTGGREPGREGSLVRGDEAAKSAGIHSRASPVADAHGGFPVAGEIDGEPLIFLPHLKKVEEGNVSFPSTRTKPTHKYKSHTAIAILGLL